MALAIVVTSLWPKSSTATLRIADHTYTLEFASTAAQQQRGLGGRPSMPTDHGMLFPYDAPGRHCFWMKDMQFALDIIWLDGDKRVVKIERDLSPSSYPTSYCANNTRYVIELNAGQAEATNLQAGQRLEF